MGIKNFDQLGFADHLVVQRCTSKQRSLEKIDAQIDWSPFSDLLLATRSKTGRKGYPPLLMFKALLLAQWNNLGDEDLEYRLSDSLSFRKFVGLPLDHPAPDETSFVNFRKALREHKLEKSLFEEINRQLDQAGLILRKGTMLDATIVQAAVNPPSREEGEVTDKDPDAEFTSKNKKLFFGYKLHIGLDQGSGLIRRLLTTGASLHDSQASYELITGDEEAVFADKAYQSGELSEKLEQAKIKDCIMRKAPANKRVPKWLKWWNRTIASDRFEVEQPFGIGKTSYGLARTRYKRKTAVQTQHYLFCSAYNLKRAFG